MTHTTENQAKPGSTGTGNLAGSGSKIEGSAKSLTDKIGDVLFGENAESQNNKSQPVQADESEVHVPDTKGHRSTAPGGKDTYHRSADKDPKPAKA